MIGVRVRIGAQARAGVNRRGVLPVLLVLAGCGTLPPPVDDAMAGAASACASGRLDAHPVGRVGAQRFFSAASMEEWGASFGRAPAPSPGFGDIERIFLTSVEIGRNRRLPGLAFRPDDAGTRLLPQAESRNATVRQVFTGELYVRWGPPFDADGVPQRRSRARARMVIEHGGGDPQKAPMLPCHTAGASPDLVCARLEVELLNPLPGGTARLAIAGTAAGPPAPCLHAASLCARIFFSPDATLAPTFPPGARWREPVVHPVATVIAPPDGRRPAQAEIAAVVDAGSYEVRSVRLFYRYHLFSLGRGTQPGGPDLSRPAAYDPAGGEALVELPFPTIVEESGNVPAALLLVTSWNVRYGVPGGSEVLEVDSPPSWHALGETAVIPPERLLPTPCRARAATH